jgi:hypothetical protein
MHGIGYLLQIDHVLLAADLSAVKAGLVFVGDVNFLCSHQRSSGGKLTR